MANKKISDLSLITLIADSNDFAVDDGTQTYRASALQLYNYLAGKIVEQNQISNLTLATSVGSSALTIAVKTQAGATPSASDYCKIGFRNSTLTSGSFNQRSITAATTLVISSGSTLGQVSAQAARIFVYLIDNAGTPELAVSLTRYPENALVSTTAEGGAGAADSASAIYSTTARSSVAVRFIGYIDNTQTTAGTWASAGTQIQLLPTISPRGPKITYYNSGSGTHLFTLGCVGAEVEMIGGGGAGGGAAATTASHGAAGGGGASGGWLKKYFDEAAVRALGGKATYTVGAGGTAGTAGANAGNNGASTTFDTLIAAGGHGGSGCASLAAVGPGGFGGAGQTNTGGDISFAGQDGSDSFLLILATIPTLFIGRGAAGLNGMTSFTGQVFANFITAITTSSFGVTPPANSGCGGMPGFNNGAGQSAVSGTPGAAGFIKITEYFY